MKDMLEITGIDLKEFAKAVYADSVPVGLGFLHARSGELPNEDVEELLERGNNHNPLMMDYVHGRGCKMTVFSDDENRLWIDNRWFDHTESQFTELMAKFDITVGE